MMILLMRHGIAEDTGGATDKEDAARALTDEGRKGVKRVARLLRDLKIEPTHFASSPRVRAKETARIVADEFEEKAKIEILDSLDFAGTLNELLSDLEKLARGEKKSVILAASHEPFCSEFLQEATELPGARLKFSKGAVAGIEWKGYPSPGSGKLRFYLTPNL